MFSAQNHCANNSGERKFKATGQINTQGTAVANLGWDEVRFPKPIFIGDTLRIETEVLDVRQSKSRPDQGIVTFAHRAYNQDDELVAHCKRASLQRKRPVAM